MHCRIEELEKEHTQLNGERQRLQEDLEEVQERLTAGVPPFCTCPIELHKTDCICVQI